MRKDGTKINLHKKYISCHFSEDNLRIVLTYETLKIARLAFKQLYICTVPGQKSWTAGCFLKQN